MNNKQATQLIGMMQAAWPLHPFPEEAPRVYRIGLDGLSPEAIAEGLKTAIQESKFCPSPAELRAFAIDAHVALALAAEPIYEPDPAMIPKPYQRPEEWALADQRDRARKERMIPARSSEE